MTTKPEDLMMNAWKQRAGTVLRLVEAIAEESRKLREFQLAAAVETHARAAATRESLAKALDVQEVWRIQTEWSSANLNTSIAYWREVWGAGARMQACLARGLGVPAGEEHPAVPAASNVALFDMMGDAYKRWLETAQQVYAASAGTARKAA